MIQCLDLLWAWCVTKSAALSMGVKSLLAIHSKAVGHCSFQLTLQVSGPVSPLASHVQLVLLLHWMQQFLQKMSVSPPKLNLSGCLGYMH